MSSAFLKRPSVPLLTTVQLSSIQGWTSTFQFLSLCWITQKFSLFLFKDFSITHLIISPSSCRKYLRFRDLEFAHLEEGNWHISCSVFTLPTSLSPGAGSFPLPTSFVDFPTAICETEDTSVLWGGTSPFPDSSAVKSLLSFRLLWAWVNVVPFLHSAFVRDSHFLSSWVNPTRCQTHRKDG